MLTLYRRHAGPSKRLPNGCPHQKDRYWRRCNCPMWVEGTDRNRVYKRESLHTRSWVEAQATITRWESTPTQSRRGHLRIELSDAADQYVAHCVQSELSPITVKKRRQLLDRFTTWCTAHDLYDLEDIDIKVLRDWTAAGQQRKASTRLQERRELHLFFAFTIREKWLDADPTENLAKPIVRQEQTGYVQAKSFIKLLTAITDPKWHALTLLLRWSGLRITDALRLERKHIVNDLLMLYTGKTSTPVVIPLPPKVIRVLDKLQAGEQFFAGETEKQADAFRSALKRASKRAGIGHVHPHQLRDTFAIELLLSGTPLDQVSKLLGHSSIRTTEQHYLPFVKARQEQLIASVRKSWSSAPPDDDVDWDAPGIELIETTQPRPLK